MSAKSDDTAAMLRTLQPGDRVRFNPARALASMDAGRGYHYLTRFYIMQLRTGTVQSVSDVLYPYRGPLAHVRWDGLGAHHHVCFVEARDLEPTDP